MRMKRKTFCNHFTVFQVEFLATRKTSHMRYIGKEIMLRNKKVLKFEKKNWFMTSMYGVNLPSCCYERVRNSLLFKISVAVQ